MKKRVLSLGTVLTMMASSMQTFAEDYSDMPTGWSNAAMTYAVNNGYIQGSNGKLNPQGLATRAQVASIFARVLKLENKADLSSYTDVNASQWYYDDLAKAVDAGLFKGSYNKLRPNDNITREEVMAIIARAYDLTGENANLSAFTDGSDVSSWAVNAVSALVENGIVNGSNGKLNPKNNITREEFAQFSGIDLKVSAQLYQYYATLKELDSKDLKITLVDLIYFLHEHEEELHLTEQFSSQVDYYYQMLQSNISLLESEDYTRIIMNLQTEVEGEEAFLLTDEIRDITSEYYEDVLLVGDTINAKDLKDSFTTDNTIITMVTILFILIILLFTFKSIALSVLLILAIEGSIFINFGIATLMNQPIFFISYIIVSAIQMGATIDYAIVVSNRYNGLRKKMDKKDALIGTLRDSISTVITSGFILIVAGFLIGFISDSGVVASIGLFLGIGTLVSLLVTIFVLPAILYVSDTIIHKTTFRKKELH